MAIFPALQKLTHMCMKNSWGNKVQCRTFRANKVQLYVSERPKVVDIDQFVLIISPILC